MNLPPESRYMQKIIPSKDWNFDRETQSRVLMKLDAIFCMMYNMFKKKGKKAMKPEPQFEPQYVTKAKEDADRAKKQAKKRSKEDMEALKSFMQRRNPGIKMLEVK